ncbi:MAG: hypothetical protein AAF705_19340 [Bacteroidota bacterium]
MNQKFIIALIFLVIYTSIQAQNIAAQQANNSIKEKVLPKIVSTNAVEYAIAFSKSQDSILFVRHEGKWGRRDNPPANIYLITQKDGIWSEPQLASFSDKTYNDSDVFIAENNTIFFTSNRPYTGKIGSGADIWKIEFEHGQWKTPIPLPVPINSSAMESSPVTNAKGDLYFTSIRELGKGMGDIYVATLNQDGTYNTPKLILPLSTVYGEWNLFVHPQEEWIIFESSGRPEGRSSYGDLYISYKIDGEWQAPKPLNSLNTTGSELNVCLGPKGKYLYFASSDRLENISVNIYKVALKEIF